MNNLKSGGTLFLAYEGRIGRASGPVMFRGGPAKCRSGPAMFWGGPACQQARKDRKVMGWVAQPAIWWPSRLYGGGLQDFSVSPSPLWVNLGF